jgi:hypothetical protein
MSDPCNISTIQRTADNDDRASTAQIVVDMANAIAAHPNNAVFIIGEAPGQLIPGCKVMTPLSILNDINALSTQRKEQSDAKKCQIGPVAFYTRLNSDDDGQQISPNQLTMAIKIFAFHRAEYRIWIIISGAPQNITDSLIQNSLACGWRTVVVS